MKKSSHFQSVRSASASITGSCSGKAAGGIPRSIASDSSGTIRQLSVLLQIRCSATSPRRVIHLLTLCSLPTAVRPNRALRPSSSVLPDGLAM